MIDVKIDTKKGAIVTHDELVVKDITIPAGFVCDGASVPAIAMPIFNNGIRYLRAAILHDFCYRTGIVPRKQADDLFKEVLREDGVTKFKSYMMWLGVRAGGGKFYNSNNK